MTQNYTFPTQPGTAVSEAIPISMDLTGAALTIEFSDRSNFAVIRLSKSATGAGRFVTIYLTAAEVDSLQDAAYRVKAVIGGNTSTVLTGRVDYQPLKASGVDSAVLDSLIARIRAVEVAVGITAGSGGGTTTPPGNTGGTGSTETTGSTTPPGGGTGGTGGSTGGSTGGGTTTPAAIATDNFNRANSASLGSTTTGSYAWATSSPTGWSISNNQLTYAGGSDNAAMINAGVSDNWKISAKLVTLPPTYPLVFAYGNSTLGFAKIYFGNGVWASQNISGSLSGNGTAPQVGDIASLTKKGTTLTVALNDVVVATWTGVTEYNTPADSFLGFMGVSGMPFAIDDFVLSTV